jgi:hypothetical protein
MELVGAKMRSITWSWWPTVTTAAPSRGRNLDQPRRGEDVERRRAGAEVDGEGARMPRLVYQHPQDVVLAERARGYAAVASVLADAEKRAVRLCFGQGFSRVGSCAALLQDVHELVGGLLQLGEQIVCSVPGHGRIKPSFTAL